MDIYQKIGRKISDVREMYSEMCRIYDPDIADCVLKGILYEEIKSGNIDFRIAEKILDEIE